MNEPAVFDGPGLTMPLDNVHRGFGGGSHARFHNVYGMLMIMATREGTAPCVTGCSCVGVMNANPANRPFVLSRANYLGGQKYDLFLFLC
jgi:alpha-glucosidase